VKALAGLDAFVDEARRRVGSADPEALVALMRAAAERRTLPWVDVPLGRETLLYRSPDLTVFVLSGLPRTAHPPHEHTMGAAIAVLAGAETNVFYAEAGPGDAIREVGRRTAHAGEVMTLDAGAIHAVQYPGDTPTTGLHAYRGDLVGASRRLWDLRGEHARPYDQDAYDALAVPLDPEP
jgi:predicted metal-dependent enzyme (double-stranded beta helix superfamily)